MIIANQPEPGPPDREYLLELVREIHTFQEELEIQNEKLQSARRKFYDLYDMYYESAPCAYLTMTPAGVITSVNGTGASLLQLEDEGGQSISFRILLDPSSESDYLALMKRLKKTGKPQHAEWKLGRTDGSSIWMRATVFPDWEDDGRLWQYRMTLVNITEQRNADEKLHQSQGLYRELVASLPSGAAFVVDKGLRFLIAEGEALHEAGMKSEDLAGKTIRDVLGDSVADASEPCFLEALRGKPFVVELEFRSRIYLTRGSPLRDGHGHIRAVMAVSFDITEHKRTETELRHRKKELEQRVRNRNAELESYARQLQRLSLALSMAEEKERKRIARLLHDDLQQILAAAKMKLEMMGLAGEWRSDSDEAIGKCVALLDDAIKKTRKFAGELHPPALRHFGLLPSLQGLAAEMKDNHGLDVHVSHRPEAEPESSSVAAFLYQAIKELLFNVVKHSAIRSASVSIGGKAGRIFIRVADQGRGDEINKVYARRNTDSGLGLLSIEERVRSMGGQMLIESAPGKGWIVTLSIPRNRSSREDVSEGSPFVVASSAAAATAGVAGPAERETGGVRARIAAANQPTSDQVFGLSY